MIATGARPNTLGIEVNQFDNIFTVHSLDDAGKIKGYIAARKPSRIGIIGGGYIGLEMVEAIREQQIETIMVHRRQGFIRRRYEYFRY